MNRHAIMLLCAVGALICLADDARAQCDQPELQALLATDADKDFHEIGKSVAISGSSLVMGAPHSSALGFGLGTGDAYTYEFVERRWTDGVHLNDLLPGSTLAVDDGFGEAVTMKKEGKLTGFFLHAGCPGLKMSVSGREHFSKRGLEWS